MFVYCNMQVTLINDHAKSHSAIFLGIRRGEGCSGACAAQKTVWGEHSVGSAALGDTSQLFAFVLNLSAKVTTQQ